MEETIGKRWSGFDWASEKKDIMIVGVGGIGSWLSLSLARIDHGLVLIDPDVVDETNVTGGQLYKSKQIGLPKVIATHEVCRDFGCTAIIDTFNEPFSEEIGALPITICGLDNMSARKQVFECWEKQWSPNGKKDNLFIDGRLTGEMYEVFCIQGDNPEQIEKYKSEHLFSDEEAQVLDCTTKQSTFGAMGIASLMTGLLCNWLTNRKMDMDFREIPFYSRVYYPLMDYKKEEVEQLIES